jgi:hypothetical protein
MSENCLSPLRLCGRGDLDDILGIPDRLVVTLRLSFSATAMEDEDPDETDSKECIGRGFGDRINLAVIDQDTVISPVETAVEDGVIDIDLSERIEEDARKAVIRLSCSCTEGVGIKSRINPGTGGVPENLVGCQTTDEIDPARTKSPAGKSLEVQNNGIPQVLTVDD